MWIFNTKVLICGFAGFAGFLIGVKFSDSRGLAMLIAIICAMLFDLFLRFTNDETENPSRRSYLVRSDLGCRDHLADPAGIIAHPNYLINVHKSHTCFERQVLSLMFFAVIRK